jgi:hypothetical protein
MTSSTALNSDALNIGLLREEYVMALTKYGEAYETYMEQLSENDGSKYVQLPNRAWWGEGALSEGAANDADDCESMCASNSECSGATFNSTLKYCWIRSGNAALSVNKDTSAIVRANKHRLQVLRALNAHVNQLNKKLLSTIKTNSEYQNAREVKIDDISASLEKDRAKLGDENRKLVAELEEYANVAENVDNQSLYAARENWLLLLLAILAALLVFYAIYNVGKLNMRESAAALTSPFTSRTN